MLSREDVEVKPLLGIVYFNLMGAVTEVPGNELFWPVYWFDSDHTSRDFALTTMPKTKSMDSIFRVTPFHEVPMSHLIWMRRKSF